MKAPHPGSVPWRGERRPPPRKREGAPGKVRQLKVSAERQDEATVHEKAPDCKKSRRTRRLP